LVPQSKKKEWNFMNKILLAAVLSLGLLSSFTIKTSQAHGFSHASHISMKKAKQIALKQVKGKIIDSRIEKDDGIIKYEFVIKTKDGWYEVEIDKATGKVLEVDKEGSNED
jgi:uncharacterized membrane protein YkoI